MVYGIGSASAYALFSQSDFRLKEKVINRVWDNQTADHVEYFVNIELGLLYMELYKNGEKVETVNFKSTKEKMVQAKKYYGKGVK